MKKIVSFVIMLNLFVKVVFSQININPPYAGIAGGELIIYNQTLWYNQERKDSIKIKIFPICAFFNGDCPVAKFSLSGEPTSYITGKELVIPKQLDSNLQNGSAVIGNFDRASVGSSKFAFGMGLYKIEFYRRVLDSIITGEYQWVFANYVYVDFRVSNTYSGLDSNYNNLQDIRIDYFTKDFITFRHYPNNPDSIKYFYNINDVNKHVKIWELYGTFLVPLPARSLGLMKLDPLYLKLPINANQFNGNVGQVNSGDLGMNIVINHNVTTQDTAFGNGNIYTAANGYLKIVSGKTFHMTKPLAGHHNLVVQDSSKLMIEAGSQIIVDSLNRLTLKSKGTIKLSNNSSIRFKRGSLFCNEGGTISNLQNGNSPIPGKIIFDTLYNQINCAPLSDININDSIKLVLEYGATLEIPDSTTLHFTGSHSGLIMNPNSKLKMGVDSKILFDNSAKIIADGATFTSIDSTKTWEGIILQNSSQDTIKNCTFKNAKTAISIVNTEGPSYYRRIIQNNVFNVPSGGNYKGIYGENNYRILVKDNTFNMPVSSGSNIYTGLYLKNSSIGTTAPELEEPEPLYTMNVIHNTFNNGSASIILANYISSFSSYYIANNTFNNASEINLIGMKINGRIKNNVFTSSTVPMAIHLINSYPDLFNNAIASRDVSLHLAGHCYPNLAPYISGEDLVWTGGMNTLITNEIDNVQLSSSGNVYTNWGNNSFNTVNSSAYHIYGLVDTSLTKYSSKNNCWSPDELAKIYLKTNHDTLSIANIFYNDGYTCVESISETGSQVNFLGSEMYDTITISNDNTGETLAEEELLYVQGKNYLSQSYYNDAITTYKYLIDNYPEYENSELAAGYLFEAYQGLDTTTDTSYRNTLYGNLKIYLENEIASGEPSGDFIDVAYDIILACEAILENYNEALNGYEFISLFHPDPNIRLIASWDYEEVEDLINSGSGQSVSNYKLQITNDQSEKNEFKRMEAIVKDVSIKSKMKKSYEKSTVERKERIDKEISSESKTTEAAKENLRKSRILDNLKEDRAKRNILQSNMLGKDELEERRMEDLILTTRNIRNEIRKNADVNNPLEYKLYQNYPNPFNPTTTISYSIPISGIVKLKIYDITGREIRLLVNEVKEAGRYKIKFDGSNLSSGIYFYKLESNGKSIDTKRMVLIK